MLASLFDSLAGWLAGRFACGSGSCKKFFFLYWGNGCEKGNEKGGLM